MESIHPLKALLQLQLATDSAVVLHTPYILASLTSDCFSPSPHLPKWTARINSLLHSKDAGSRWAGLCIAHKTSTLSKDIMIEFSQSWLGVALPMLSKNEPPPTIKAAIRLLRIIFSAGVGIPEFQRQVTTPNVPKFTAAMMVLADKPGDEELKALILKTLTYLVSLYPSAHRASHSALSTLSLRFLNGSFPRPTSRILLEAASGLYATLPFTGGKVGAASLWRKALDETLESGWSAFLAMRTTFSSEGRNTAMLTGEPHITIPLNLDRLRCCIAVLCDLLSSPTHRPVQVPLGSLVKFAITLLSCSTNNEKSEHPDVSTRAMEVLAIPKILEYSCDLISGLAQSARHHLIPDLTRLVSYLTFHLEQKLTPSQRLSFLTALKSLFVFCHSFDSSLVLNRLAKAVLPTITVILSSPSESTVESPNVAANGRKSKKRVRGYEGDEVFKLSREVICPSMDDGKALFVAFEVMQLLMRNHSLSPAIQSISARVLLSVLLVLPQISPASLSADPTLHNKLLQLVHTISIELGSGTTSVMSKSLGLIIHTTMNNEDHDASLRDLDILIHPRVPPLICSLPHVESFSLFRAEEPQEEVEARKALGLQDSHPDQPPPTQPITLDSEVITLPPNANANSNPPAPPELLPPANMVPQLPPPPASLGNTLEESAPSKLILSAPVSPRATTTHNILSHPLTPRFNPTVIPTDEEDGEMPAIDLDSDSDMDI